MKTALVFGSSGLVGQQLVQQLIQNDSYKKIKDKTSNYLNVSTELGNYLKLEAKDTYKT